MKNFVAILILSVSFIACDMSKDMMMTAMNENEMTELTVEDDLPTIDFNPDIEKTTEPFDIQAGDVVRYIDEFVDSEVFETVEAAYKSDVVSQSYAKALDVLDRFCAGEITKNDITQSSGNEYENSRFHLYFTNRDERAKYALPETEPNPSFTYDIRVIDVVGDEARFRFDAIITHPDGQCPVDEEELPTIDFNPDIEKPTELFVRQVGDVVRYLDEFVDSEVFETAEAAYKSDVFSQSYAKMRDVIDRFCAGEITKNDITQSSGNEYENSRFHLYFTNRDERSKFALPQTYPNPSLTFDRRVVDVVGDEARFRFDAILTHPDGECE